MTEKLLETDYLVVGAGAVGMAFADAMVTESDRELILFDRRHAPGGHWHDAYPFVRLHNPSSVYGVNSLPLGQERLESSGLNEGLYERATASEICAYFGRVLEHRLLPSGRVRFFPSSDYLGDRRFRSRMTGECAPWPSPETTPSTPSCA